MVSANAQLVERVVDAVTRRDAEGLAQLVSDDFQWVTRAAGVDVAVYEGREGIGRFFTDARRWASIEARVDDIHDLGDRALVLGEQTWRAQARGATDVQRPLASVFYFDAGAVSKIHSYRTANDAWVASGLGRPRY